MCHKIACYPGHLHVKQCRTTTQRYWTTVPCVRDLANPQKGKPRGIDIAMIRVARTSNGLVRRCTAKREVEAQQAVVGPTFVGKAPLATRGLPGPHELIAAVAEDEARGVGFTSERTADALHGKEAMATMRVDRRSKITAKRENPEAALPQGGVRGPSVTTVTSARKFSLKGELGLTMPGCNCPGPTPAPCAR